MKVDDLIKKYTTYLSEESKFLADLQSTKPFKVLTMSHTTGKLDMIVKILRDLQIFKSNSD